MTLTLPVVSVTASGIATFGDCQARFYHEQQRYPDGGLPTDSTAATVSSAVHDAFMIHHRQIEQNSQMRRLPTIDGSRVRLRALVDQQLCRKRIDRSNTAVANRLAKLDIGIDRTADLLLEGATAWAVDAQGDLLVWVEAWLDHGPDVKAIELAPGFLVRTRPDVFGIRALGDGRYRVLIRDYKAKNEVVDPAFDSGILLRAIWAVLELRNPRCRWFVSGRTIQIDAERVDLETVNVMHTSGNDFLVRATLTADQLLEHRDRFVGTMSDMSGVLQSECVGEVLASPSGLCHQWCPFLDRCEPGMAHVRKYYGEEALLERVGA